MWSYECDLWFLSLSFLIYKSGIKIPSFIGWNETRGMKYFAQVLAHRKPPFYLSLFFFLFHQEKGNRSECKLSPCFCFELRLLYSVMTCIDSISRYFLGDFNYIFPLGPFYPETATRKVRQFNAVALHHDNSVVDMTAPCVKILWQP